MAVDTIAVEQKRGGTFRENLVKLQKEFSEIVELGPIDPAAYERVLVSLLKSFEGERLKAESQIRKLQSEVAFNEATIKNASKFSNLLLSVIASFKREWSNERQRQEAMVGVAQHVGEVKTDKEVLQTICACGCVDDEDISKCACSCHKGVPCDNPHCVVCTAAKADTKADTKTKIKAKAKTDGSNGEPPKKRKRESGKSQKCQEESAKKTSKTSKSSTQKN